MSLLESNFYGGCSQRTIGANFNISLGFKRMQLCDVTGSRIGTLPDARRLPIRKGWRIFAIWNVGTGTITVQNKSAGIPDTIGSIGPGEVGLIGLSDNSTTEGKWHMKVSAILGGPDPWWTTTTTTTTTTPPPTTPPPTTTTPILTCLAYGTRIFTPTGSCFVETLLVGSYVKSLAGNAKVTGTRHALYDETYLINDNLRATWDHPILVKRDERWKFVNVKDLNVGDILNTTFGVESEVKSLKLIKETIAAVLLKLENANTYFANGIAVGTDEVSR